MIILITTIINNEQTMSIFRFPVLVWLGIGILIICLGIRQSFGIFMMPISDYFQTGREFFSFAIALQNLLFGVFQPFVGMASDRWGAEAYYHFRCLFLRFRSLPYFYRH